VNNGYTSSDFNASIERVKFHPSSPSPEGHGRDFSDSYPDNNWPHLLRGPSIQIVGAGGKAAQERGSGQKKRRKNPRGDVPA